MTGLSRRDLLRHSTAAGLTATMSLQGLAPALSQQGEQLLVVMWGAAWIDVCRRIAEAYSPPSLIMTGISESLSRQGSDEGDSWPGKRLPSRNTWSGSTRRNAIDSTS